MGSACIIFLEGREGVEVPEGKRIIHMHVKLQDVSAEHGLGI